MDVIFKSSSWPSSASVICFQLARINFLASSSRTVPLFISEQYHCLSKNFSSLGDKENAAFYYQRDPLRTARSRTFHPRILRNDERRRPRTSFL